MKKDNNVILKKYSGKEAYAMQCYHDDMPNMIEQGYKSESTNWVQGSHGCLKPFIAILLIPVFGIGLLLLLALLIDKPKTGTLMVTWVKR